MNKKTAYTFVFLAFLLFPTSAYCFPFIMAGGGFAVLPFFLACISTLSRNKIAIVAATLFSLITYQLATPDFSEISGVQEKDDNRLATMMSNEKLIESHIIGKDTQKLAMSYTDALATGRKLIYVNAGGNQNFPGVSLVDLATNAAFLDKSEILISSDKFLTANASRITGQSYVSDSVNDIFTKNISENKVNAPNCTKEKCAKIALIDGYYFLYSGYPYKNFVDSVTTSALLIDPKNGIDRIKKISNNGATPIYIEYFGVDERPALKSGINNFLSNNGLKNFQVDIYEEVDKTPDNFEMLAKNFFHNRNLIPFNEVAYLCKDDSTLITTFNDEAEQKILLSNYVLEKCNIKNFPIVGMTAHDAEKYLNQKISDLPTGRRYIGVYSDKVSAFYTGITIEFLASHGFNIIGKSAITVDAEELKNFDQAYGLKHMLDSASNKIIKRLIGKDDQPSYLGIVSFSLLISFTFTFAFLYFKNHFLVQLLWIFNVLFLAYFQLLYFYFSPAKNIDPVNFAIIILFVQLGITAVYQSISKIENINKLTGLVWLKKSGFKVLPWILIESPIDGSIERAMKEFSESVIFRSNEASEGISAHSSGRYQSVICTGKCDHEALINSWKLMESSGGKPSFVAQPYVKFTKSGVARLYATESGTVLLTIESSSRAQAVTANHSEDITTETISLDSLLFSSEALHKDCYRIFRKLKTTFTAEFGFVGNHVIWTQILVSKAHPSILLNESNGFQKSGFNLEITKPNLFAVSVLNKYLPWTDHKLHKGEIIEKQNAWISAFKLISYFIPAKMLITAASVLTKEIYKNEVASNSKILRFAFILNQICKMKNTDQVILHELDESLLDMINSSKFSYDNFQDSKKVIIEDKRLKLIQGTILQRPEFIAMELCRLVITDQLQKLVYECNLIVRNNNLHSTALDILSVNDLRSGSIIRNYCPPDFECDRQFLKGFKICSGDTFQINEFSDLDHLYAKIKLCSGAAIKMIQPIDEILNLHQHIAKITIRKKLVRNSHFVQRCMAYGITLEYE